MNIAAGCGEETNLGGREFYIVVTIVAPASKQMFAHSSIACSSIGEISLHDGLQFT